MRLLNSQKDTLFDLIEHNLLSPVQFEFVEENSKNRKNDVATILYFKNSNYFFSFDTSALSATDHYAFYCPGEESYKKTANNGTWSSQLGSFQMWLRNLKREITAPNKWDRMQVELSKVSFLFNKDENKFTVQEFEDLKLKIESLKSNLTKLNLVEEQFQTINNKLDDITNLAKTMNKFDWQSLFMGTIINLIMQLSLTPDNSKELWNIIKLTFNNLILN